MPYSKATTRAAGYSVLYTDWNTLVNNFNALVIGLVPGGRLTGTTGNATSDSSSTATIYYTPYLHSGIKLYDGADWIFYNFSEMSLSLSGYTTGTNYDIFVYNNSGTLALESTAWTNDTTRATGLVRQDGALVKSGTTTRLYVGTIRTSATGQTIDSTGFRFMWNYYNRIKKEVIITDTTDNWTYATNTWRSWNNSTANTIGMVRGRDEDPIDVTFIATLAGGNGVIGLQVGSAGGDGLVAHTNDTSLETISTRYTKLPGLGYRALYLSEKAVSGTTTFYGDGGGSFQSGARGWVMC